MDGRLVGCLIGRTETKKERSRGYLAMIVVENDVRRAGVGRRLVDEWMNRLSGKVDEFVL
jgi:ribosomal protein S18 acetylase RimI-like enzyme